MSTYEPGQVAVATVRGVPNVRVFHYEYDGVRGWCSDEQVEGETDHAEYVVTDIRPLVVLDFGTRTDLTSLVRLLRDDNNSPLDRATSRSIADQIEQQTKPPRIPEPGLWGVVEAPDGAQYVRIDTAPENHSWQLLGEPSAVDERYVRWSDIADPKPIRPGIEDGAS
jgi:hypothetical protein